MRPSQLGAIPSFVTRSPESMERAFDEAARHALGDVGPLHILHASGVYVFVIRETAYADENPLFGTRAWSLREVVPSGVRLRIFVVAPENEAALAGLLALAETARFEPGTREGVDDWAHTHGVMVYPL